MADADDPLERLAVLIATGPPWMRRLAAKLAEILRPPADGGGPPTRTLH